MIHFLSRTLLGLVFISLTCAQGAPVANIDFNANWQFHYGTVDDGQSVAFDDSQWRRVNLPHDWAIEGPFDIKYNARKRQSYQGILE